MGIPLCLLVAWFCMSNAVAQGGGNQQGPASAAKLFRAHQLEREGQPALAYRLRQPSGEGERGAHPLLVFLHGAGERGEDNLGQLAHLPERLGREDYAGCFPGYVLAMQCPTDQRWVEASWSDVPPPPMSPEPSQPMANLIQVLEHVFATEPIDRSRVVLTGLSMGGQGAWELAVRRPSWFAALAPICGGADPARVGVLKGLPVFAWHGVDDGAVPIERSRLMVQALRKAGGDVRFVELPIGTGHAAWNAAYDSKSELWPWLRSAQRPYSELLLEGFEEESGASPIRMAPGSHLWVAVSPRPSVSSVALWLEGLLTCSPKDPKNPSIARVRITGALLGPGDLALDPGVAVDLSEMNGSAWGGQLRLRGGELELGARGPAGGWGLEVHGAATLRCATARGSLRIAEVLAQLELVGWSKELRIEAAEEHLRWLRFVNPAGLPAGEYAARQGVDGVVPVKR